MEGGLIPGLARYRTTMGSELYRACPYLQPAVQLGLRDSFRVFESSGG